MPARALAVDDVAGHSRVGLLGGARVSGSYPDYPAPVLVPRKLRTEVTSYGAADGECWRSPRHPHPLASGRGVPGGAVGVRGVRRGRDLRLHRCGSGVDGLCPPEEVVLDAVDDGAGRFRIVIRPDPADAPWPDTHYLRQGVSVKAWVLLHTVPLWQEVWRQLNGFPPVVATKEPVTKKAPDA